MTPEQLLDFEFDSSDLGERLSVREYFVRLLHQLWVEGEAFSSKRPFGGSSEWQSDIEAALVRDGLVAGDREYGEADEDVEPLILAAIERLGRSQDAEAQ